MLGLCTVKITFGDTTVPQPPLHPEPSSTELTLLSLLRDRRDSSGSATSSAYLSSSRRSSGISHCFSSRRSSQASQSEHSQQRQLHNLSVTDSYDPISTDASRRSSEASQCGGSGSGAVGGGSGAVGRGRMGSRGVLNLTPAQNYHLKATYAAATGGPPLTPLSNMEQVSYEIQMTMGRDVKETNQIILPSVVRTCCSSDSSSHGQCSHIRYIWRGLCPGHIPGNSERRASDPLRPRDQSTIGRSQTHRFDSQNNMDHFPLLDGNNAPSGAGKSTNLKNYKKIEGNVQSGQLSPFSSSSIEQSTLETLSIEHDGALLFRNDDIFPEDHEAPCSQQNVINSQCHKNYLSRNSERVQNIQNSSQQHGEQERQSPGKDSLPIHWNEVSSGSTDFSPPLGPWHCGHWPNQIIAVSLPFGRFENMIVEQQLPSYFTDQKHPYQRDTIQQITELTNGQSYPYPNRQGSNSSKQLSSRMSQGVSVETTQWNCNGTRRNSSSTYFFGQQNCQNPLGPIQRSSVHQTSQSQIQQSNEGPRGNSLNQGTVNSSLSHIFVLSLQSQCAKASQSVDQDPSQQQQYSTQQIISSQNEHAYQSFTKGIISNCSLANQVSGLKLEIEDQLQPTSCSSMQQQQVFEQSYDPGKSSILRAQHSQMESLKIETGISCGPLEDHLSPGADQVTSTVDSSPYGRVQDNVGLHFSSILDDSLNQGCLVVDVSSPSVHDLSKTSSWLTTPHLSAVLHSLPHGTTNMAIGDMSSLLTTLAEENKFLAILQ